MELKNFTPMKWLLMMMLFVSVVSHAQTTNVWTGNTSRKWTTGTNWSLGVRPTQQHNVIVPVVANGRYPEIAPTYGVTYCNDITIQSGANLKISGSYGLLRIGGVITNNGIFDATDGTVEMGMAGAQILPANAFLNNTIRNLTIFHNSLSGSTTIQGNLNVTGVLAVKIGTLYTNDALTLKSTPTNTAMVAEMNPANSNIVGNVTVERYMPAKRAYRQICASTTGGTISSNWQEGGADVAGLGCDITGMGGATNGFDPSNNNSPSMYTWDFVNAQWAPVTSTLGTMQTGVPYLLFLRGDRSVNQYVSSSPATATTLRTTGTLTIGDVALTQFSANAGGFNYVANPYQAPVDMKEVLAESNNLVADYMYIWDPNVGDTGGYVVVNVENDLTSVASSEVTRFLQPNQVCFVRTDVPGSTSTLLFKESHKAIYENTTPSVYRTAEGLATINGTLYRGNGVIADGFAVSFGEDANNEVDLRDAKKMSNNGENVGIKNGATILSLEKRQMPTAGDVLVINTANYKTTNYTLKLKVNGSLGLSAQLFDSYTGIYTPLPAGEETAYSFTADATNAQSTAANRFNIVFTSTSLKNDNFINSDFSVYPNPVTNNNFTVETPFEGNTTVALFNQLGQQINCKTSANGTAVAVEPQTELASGIYMVQITDGMKSASKKLIIK